MAGIKIVDLPAVGRDLAATDLFEMSLVGGTGSRKITGQEIMNASKLSVNNTPVINGTSGRIFFQDAANVLQQSANLFWDNTNNRLGIGTSSPFGSFDVRDGDIFATISSNANLRSRLTYQGLYVSRSTDGTYTENIISTTSAWLYNSRNSHSFFRDGTNLFNVGVALSSGLNINGAGNVLIGTTIDAGYKFDVNGNARMNSIHGGGTSTLLLQSHVGAGAAITVQFGSNQNATSGDRPIISAIGLFNPTSGASTFAGLSFTPTINQTGSANGITRGLYIAPTLTAAADFRAIETTAGKVIFNGDNAANVQAGYNLMLKGGNPRLRIEGGTAGTSLADAVIQFADSAGDNWIIKTNRANGNLVFGLGWNNSVTNIVTLGSTSIQPALGVTGISSSTGTALSVQNSSLSSLLTVLNTGNVLINTTTDAGFRLDVNGTARVVGRITAGDASTAGDIRSNPSVALNFGGGQTTNTFTFRQINNGAFSPSGLDQSLINLAINQAESTANPNRGSIIAMSGTINNTGGTGNVYRGIYYNPTIVSLTNTQHFAWHSTSGRFKIEGLPTSPTGLTAGELWNNGGVINIV